MTNVKVVLLSFAICLASYGWYIAGQSNVKRFVIVRMFDSDKSFGPYYGICEFYQDKVFCATMDDD